jgi:hypothetical protein
MARESEAEGEQLHRVLQVGWTSLTQALRLLSEIPLDAANDAVMTKQLAAQRYATSLLVRLRRLARNEPDAITSDEEPDDDDEI